MTNVSRSGPTDGFVNSHNYRDWVVLKWMFGLKDYGFLAFFVGLIRRISLLDNLPPSGTPNGGAKVVIPTGPVLGPNFAPSRGRRVSSLAATGVAGRQPTGRALPSLIVGAPDSVSAHVCAARAVSPVASLINLALPMRVRSLLSSHLSDAKGTVARRNNAVEVFRDISDKMAPYRVVWAAKLPEGSPAREINLPLLHLLVKRFDYPDSQIINDLRTGMPIAGVIPECKTLEPRAKPAKLTTQEWIERMPERNKKAIGRAERFRHTEIGKGCWLKSLREVDAGWISPPQELNAETSASLNLTPRFAIFGQHGNGPMKVRIIDDMKASDVDDVTSTKDTAVPDSLGVFLAAASYYRLIRPGCDLLAASSDFCHAYKTLGIPEDNGLFSTVLLGPPAGPLMVSRLRTQPFGSTRAPANWGRVARLLQWALLTRFGVYLPIYVDDCFLIEPAETAEIAYLRANIFNALCGFRLGKFNRPQPSLLLLGAQVTICPDFVSAALPLKRRGDLVEEVQRVLAADALTPGQAAKLRGRLGFAQSLMFGKYGRALLQPLTNRQYSRAVRGEHTSNQELREVLPWWAAVLRNAAGRRTWFRGPKPVVVYVDAAGCGHIGDVVYVDDERHVFSSHIPEWMEAGQCDIYDMEMCASMLGLCLVAESWPGRPAILRCDNRGATQTLVRGACRSPLSQKTCAAFWCLAASKSVPVWIEDVPGVLNPTDPPSRGCPRCGKSINAVSKRCEVPNYFSRIFSSLEALDNSQFSTPSGSQEFTPAWACPCANIS